MTLRQGNKKGDSTNRLGGSVKDWNFRVRRDAEQFGRWLEAHRLIEPRLEIPHSLIHEDDSGTFVHADDAAQPSLKPDDISGSQLERRLWQSPDDAELDLVRVMPWAFGWLFHPATPFLSTVSSPS